MLHTIHVDNITEIQHENTQKGHVTQVFSLNFSKRLKDVWIPRHW